MYVLCCYPQVFGEGVGLRPFAYCDRGFESHRVHGCWSVVWCQVEVSATSWSLVQRSSTDYGASLCVIKKPRERGGHSQRWAAEPEKQTNYIQECHRACESRSESITFMYFVESEVSIPYLHQSLATSYCEKRWLEYSTHKWSLYAASRYSKTLSLRD
jgi:hypothetical protein